MKKIMFIFLLALLVGGCFFSKKKSYEHRAFQLVYNSDTRGFYNPCG